MTEPTEPKPVTRRMFLICKVLEPKRLKGGEYAPMVPLFLAAEAVASTAMEHPEWDLDEEKTWAEWEQHG